jgi:hypothetical protein
MNWLKKKNRSKGRETLEVTSQQAAHFFSIFRYTLVLYVVIFSLLFVTLIPVLFGFQVSIVQQKATDGADIPRGAVIISKPLEYEGSHFNEPALKKRMKETEIPLVVEMKTKLEKESREKMQGKYLYYVPFVGYIIEPLKQAALPSFLLFVLLYLFTYRAH